MEIFFYNSSVEVPFETPYSDKLSPDKQLLLISNHQQFMETFETLRDRIIEEGIGDIRGKKIFVPVAVKDIFLNWLRKAYADVKWEKTAKLTGFKPNVTGELEAFFRQMEIAEEWENFAKEIDVSLQSEEITLPTTGRTTSQPEKSDLDKSEYLNWLLVLLILVVFVTFVWLLSPSGDSRKYQQVKEYVQQNKCEEAKEMTRGLESLEKRVRIACAELKLESTMNPPPGDAANSACEKKAEGVIQHTVKSDENLGTIARNNNVSSDEIYNLHKRDGKAFVCKSGGKEEEWVDKKVIKPDWVLRIPKHHSN